MTRSPSYLLTLLQQASPQRAFLKVVRSCRWNVLDRGVAVLLMATFTFTRISISWLRLWWFVPPRKLKVTPLIGCRTVRSTLRVQGLPFIKTKHRSWPVPRTGSILVSRLVRIAINIRLHILLGVSILAART